MNRLEAIRAVLEGKKVTHPDNKHGSYYCLGDKDILFHRSDLDGSPPRTAIFGSANGYEIIKTKVKKSGEFFIGDFGMNYLKGNALIQPALSIEETVHYKNKVTVTWEEEE